jgi:hypothetical protein
MGVLFVRFIASGGYNSLVQASGKDKGAAQRKDAGRASLRKSLIFMIFSLISDALSITQSNRVAPSPIKTMEQKLTRTKLNCLARTWHEDKSPFVSFATFCSIPVAPSRTQSHSVASVQLIVPNQADGP